MVHWVLVFLLMGLATGLAFRIAWVVPFRWLKVVTFLLACGFLVSLLMYAVSSPL